MKVVSKVIDCYIYNTDKTISISNESFYIFNEEYDNRDSYYYEPCIIDHSKDELILQIEFLTEEVKEFITNNTVNLSYILLYDDSTSKTKTINNLKFAKGILRKRIKVTGNNDLRDINFFNYEVYRAKIKPIDITN